MIRVLNTILFLFFSLFSFSQIAGYQQIKGLPTKEIYDLLVDKKGFIWIGHNLGLSRFDGVSFTHFYNPQQTSLAVGDLTEDKQGRIWCRSFSSQVFYVENERMNLLSSYDFTKEPRFPLMVLQGNKLIVTSSRGLFVCNTSTLQCSYKSIGKSTNNLTGTTSLAVISNKIITYGNGQWFSYNPNTDIISPLTIKESKYSVEKGITLQPSTNNDTIYTISNLSGCINKLVLNGNDLNLVSKIKTPVL